MLDAMASPDTLLDAIALIEAHLNHDNEAVGAILHSCDLAQTANLCAFLLAGVLHGLAERDGVDPMSLLHGVDELRASVLRGGD